MTKMLPLVLVATSCLAASASAQVRVDTGGTSVVVGGGTSVVVGGGSGTSVVVGGGGGVDVRTGGGSTSVTTKGGDVSASVGKGNVVGSTVGGVSPNQQGVAVVNGKVFIDGKEIPPKVTRYKSPKTGEVYLIRREGGSVEVTTE